MTTVRTLAAYEIVQAVHPRPVTERDELGLAVGRAIDSVLSRYSHEFRASRRPTAAAMNRLAAETLDGELADADLSLVPADRDKQLAQVAGVLQAFRRSEVMGLLRPKSRLVLINERAGFYAQPDYWNGRDRFYEMKSYLALPIPSGVELQLQLFQLAFPNFAAVLASFDRHVAPVATVLTEIPALSAADRDRLLPLAFRTAGELGKDRVLEYIDSPIVRYSIPV